MDQSGRIITFSRRGGEPSHFYQKKGGSQRAKGGENQLKNAISGKGGKAYSNYSGKKALGKTKPFEPGKEKRISAPFRRERGNRKLYS